MIEVFNVRKKQKSNTLIAQGIQLEGNLQGSGMLRIYGEIKGDIQFEGDIVIGESGKIQGNINCTNLLVGGTVQGDVKAEQHFRLVSGGKLYGNIKTKIMVIDENSIFTGMSEMMDDNALREYAEENEAKKERNKKER